MRAIDVAPTIAFLLGIPGPQNAQGKILYDIVDFGHGRPRPWQKGPTEITILDISDYHGQLVPLSEAADNSPRRAAAPVNPLFNIGGSAFLKPWFDEYRKEARDGSITIAAGDSVGATPPISSFFGDTPTMELMNLMGFSADGLGNHNFDKGQQYLRNTLIPAGELPVHLGERRRRRPGRRRHSGSPSKPSSSATASTSSWSGSRTRTLRSSSSRTPSIRSRSRTLLRR